MPNDGGLCQSSGNANAHQFIAASRRLSCINGGPSATAASAEADRIQEARLIDRRAMP